MRWLVLTLAAAAAGGFYAYQFPLDAQATAVGGTTDQSPGSSLKQPTTQPLNSEDRIVLSREQRRQASLEGGFADVPRSLLRIERRMPYGDYEWNDEGVPEGPVTIRVDLRTQLMSVFRAGHEIGTAVALYGADAKETPLGSFPILWKGRDHVSSLYDAPMPFTLRLTGDGVAIHGSNVRWGAATHGCVGVPTEFARRLFEEARVGDVVTIVRTPPRPPRKEAAS